MNVQGNMRKSSLNPQNAIQKSLNALDFQQNKNQGSNGLNNPLNRNPSGRSREKLPEIGIH